MNKSIKKFLITVSAVGALLFPALTPSLVDAADVAGNLCNGTQLSANAAGPAVCDNGATDQTLQNTVDLVVNLLSLIVGLAASVMITFGVYYGAVSSAGSDAAKRAKNSVIYAMIGLVVVALAQVIVRVVVGKANTIN
jgi:hypothetical protein